MVRESFLQPTRGGYQGSELAADSFIRPLSRKGIRWLHATVVAWMMREIVFILHPLCLDWRELLLSAALYPLLLLILTCFVLLLRWKTSQISSRCLPFLAKKLGYCETRSWNSFRFLSSLFAAAWQRNGDWKLGLSEVGRALLLVGFKFGLWEFCQMGVGGTSPAQILFW